MYNQQVITAHWAATQLTLILLSEVPLPSVITDRIWAFITKSKAKISFERCDVSILSRWETFLDYGELIHVTLNAVYIQTGLDVLYIEIFFYADMLQVFVSGK